MSNIINELSEFLKTSSDEEILNSLDKNLLIDYVTQLTPNGNQNKDMYEPMSPAELLCLLRFTLDDKGRKDDYYEKARRATRILCKQVKAIEMSNGKLVGINTHVTGETVDSKVYTGKISSIYHSYFTLVGKLDEKCGVHKLSYEDIKTLHQ